MVSIEKISQKFIQLENYLGLLKEISKEPEEAFLKNQIIIGSAKYYLQVSIECCLDVANHIIASERLRAPNDYADSFTVLEEKGLFHQQLGQRLRQMAKFRNRLVHLYGEIDDKFVHEFLKTDVEDIRKFRKIIIEQYAK
ncbi:hypothetical protein BuS5_03743 [Desulfosarcina sp. BuS5]|uniref:type VII toxin-antitoxin system HepT family RNase toxin n=1 Tax=Desulfosarcina sp. BuS5 TaxID=933262 RepID=UPI000684ECE3|nr:DUF86 domain-containing protein [Desulfosarcina sp. BuS5]WDN90772.1 hypothetical protein BuS5_03743 [Desulfosarcina sp. BuS5]